MQISILKCIASQVACARRRPQLEAAIDPCHTSSCIGKSTDNSGAKLSSSDACLFPKDHAVSNFAKISIAHSKLVLVSCLSPAYGIHCEDRLSLLLIRICVCNWRVFQNGAADATTSRGQSPDQVCGASVSSIPSLARLCVAVYDSMAHLLGLLPLSRALREAHWCSRMDFRMDGNHHHLPELGLAEHPLERQCQGSVHCQEGPIGRRGPVDQGHSCGKCWCS